MGHRLDGSPLTSAISPGRGREYLRAALRWRRDYARALRSEALLVAVGGPSLNVVELDRQANGHDLIGDLLENALSAIEKKVGAS